MCAPQTPSSLVMMRRNWALGLGGIKSSYPWLSGRTMSWLRIRLDVLSPMSVNPDGRIAPSPLPGLSLRAEFREFPSQTANRIQLFPIPSVAADCLTLSTMPLASTSICFFSPASSLGLSHFDVSLRR